MDEEYKRPKRKKHIFGRIMAFLALTLLCVIVTLFGVVWVALRGASPTITAAVCNSLRETSALRWIPGLFLSEEELDSYLLKSTEDMETEQVNTSLIHIAEARQREQKPGDELAGYVAAQAVFAAFEHAVYDEIVLRLCP